MPSSKNILQQKVEEIAKKAGNDICAECSQRHPVWVSLLKPAFPGGEILAVFLCNKCCRHHLELGAKVCQVKSISLAVEWSRSEVEILKTTGNTLVNEIYEAKLDDLVNDKDIVTFDKEEEHNARYTFVKNKYQKLHYFDEEYYHSIMLQRNPKYDKNALPSPETTTVATTTTTTTTQEATTCDKPARRSSLGASSLVIPETPRIKRQGKVGMYSTKKSKPEVQEPESQEISEKSPTASRRTIPPSPHVRSLLGLPANLEIKRTPSRRNLLSSQQERNTSLRNMKTDTMNLRSLLLGEAERHRSERNLLAAVCGGEYTAKSSQERHSNPDSADDRMSFIAKTNSSRSLRNGDAGDPRFTLTKSSSTRSLHRRRHPSKDSVSSLLEYGSPTKEELILEKPSRRQPRRSSLGTPEPSWGNGPDPSLLEYGPATRVKSSRMETTSRQQHRRSSLGGCEQSMENSIRNGPDPSLLEYGTPLREKSNRKKTSRRQNRRSSVGAYEQSMENGPGPDPSLLEYGFSTREKSNQKKILQRQQRRSSVGACEQHMNNGPDPALLGYGISVREELSLARTSHRPSRRSSLRAHEQSRKSDPDPPLKYGTSTREESTQEKEMLQQHQQSLLGGRQHRRSSLGAREHASRHDRSSATGKSAGGAKARMRSCSRGTLRSLSNSDDTQEAKVFKRKSSRKEAKRVKALFDRKKLPDRKNLSLSERKKEVPSHDRRKHPSTKIQRSHSALSLLIGNDSSNVEKGEKPDHIWKLHDDNRKSVPALTMRDSREESAGELRGRSRSYSTVDTQDSDDDEQCLDRNKLYSSRISEKHRAAKYSNPPVGVKKQRSTSKLSNLTDGVKDSIPSGALGKLISGDTRNEDMLDAYSRKRDRREGKRSKVAIKGSSAMHSSIRGLANTESLDKRKSKSGLRRSHASQSTGALGLLTAQSKKEEKNSYSNISGFDKKSQKTLKQREYSKQSSKEGAPVQNFDNKMYQNAMVAQWLVAST